MDLPMLPAPECPPLNTMPWPKFGCPLIGGLRVFVRAGELWIAESYDGPFIENPYQQLPAHLRGFTGMCRDYSLCADGVLWSADRSLDEFLSHPEKYPARSVQLHVVDMVAIDVLEGAETSPPFMDRCEQYMNLIALHQPAHVVAVEQVILHTEGKAKEMYAVVRAQGHCGLMLRTMVGEYASGPATKELYHYAPDLIPPTIDLGVRKDQ